VGEGKPCALGGDRVEQADGGWAGAGPFGFGHHLPGRGVSFCLPDPGQGGQAGGQRLGVAELPAQRQPGLGSRRAAASSWWPTGRPWWPLVAATSALGSLRSQGRPLSWRAVTALAAAAAILAGWAAAEVASVTYTPITANSGTISDPLSGMQGWLTDGLLAVTLILMLATMAALRPGVRRRAVVLLLPALVTTALVCWGFQGFVPTGPPFGPLMLSPLQWQDLVLVPVIGVVAGFTGLRLYERLLRRRESEKPG